MVINTNYLAIRNDRLLSESATRLAHSLARLSSGGRIVSPEDDSAGLAVFSKMTAESHRNTAAMSNLSNAISYSQTQDGALSKIQKTLDRMSELAMLAQDVTKSDSDRANYDAEFQLLQDFISAADSANFNGIPLFELGSTLDFLGSVSDDGSGEDSQVIDSNFTSGVVNLNFDFSGNAGTLKIYYPPRAQGGSAIYDSGSVSGSQSVEVDFGEGSSTEIEIVVNEGGGTPGTDWNYSGSVLRNLNLSTLVDGNGSRFTLTAITQISISASVEDITAAQSALEDVKTQIDVLARQRAVVGANITRLQSELETLSVLNENLDATRSRIGDADIAKESTEFVRQRLLTESGMALAAQANALPALVLRLLGDTASKAGLD